MQLVGSIAALATSIVLFVALMLMDRTAEGSIKTQQACVAREQARVASPTKFNTNPCFQWDGETCRRGEMTRQGCELPRRLWVDALRTLSLCSFVVGVVLMFVPHDAAHHKKRE